MKTKYSLAGILALILAMPMAWAEPPVAGASAPQQAGAWLHADQLALQEVRQRLAEHTGDQGDTTPLLPVIDEFRALIENDPELFMLFTQMFEQIPHEPRYEKDPAGNPAVRDYREMLQVMNRILTQAPEFNQTGMAGFPINAMVNWAMGTPAGATAFLNDKVNRQLKKILAQWAVYLRSPNSRTALSDDPKTGWLGRDALAAMPTLVQDFVSDPQLPYYGFGSWDDFFTRVFREGRRPVASPDDDRVIANACESVPYRLATQVKLRDQFWIKDQPYSLAHMLADDPLAAQFEGGTVYQAFLSAFSYHRWHSPVSGRIVKTRVIDGSYYAAAHALGFEQYNPNGSQRYLTQVAARALIFIQADHPAIGLMAVMFVGMGEVSSTEINVYPGQQVKKGEQLGMFHFGGSTHTLIFRPQVDLEFDLRGQTPGVFPEKPLNIPVRARIATVRAAGAN
ncbi:phosphatidylserine decarboxylase family protein [uncultured Thiodictyon sp.]|uniref:phosphatidylserine decarboxylase family protein n=1 Tax=uncultured Thiodictyon sp. TaxID=1846217 RepID=UPI0025DAEEB0|nr:phosphatidylserine decarboxylase family protein [uncultured Thiodictyon sp.]